MYIEITLYLLFIIVFRYLHSKYLNIYYLHIYNIIIYTYMIVNLDCYYKLSKVINFIEPANYTLLTGSKNLLLKQSVQ